MNERYRQSVTVSGKTVDEAIAEAERELGVTRDRLDITVITEGSKGFLGMRAENARILAMVVGGEAPSGGVGATSAPAAPAGPAPAGPAPTTPARTAPAPLELDTAAATPSPLAGPATPAGRPRSASGRGAPPRPGTAAPTREMDADDYAVDVGEEYGAEEPDAEEPVEPGKRAQQRQEAAEVALEIVETLLRGMDIRARVSIRSTGDPIMLDIETDNGGLLIGRRGETLSALQYLVNVLVGRRTRGWTKVVIDVEHWREHREETLRALALRQADRVRQQRRAIALDPMPANERRIIHLALQDHRDVETHSEGEEPNRRLIITPRR